MNEESDLMSGFSPRTLLAILTLAVVLIISGVAGALAQDQVEEYTLTANTGSGQGSVELDPSGGEYEDGTVVEVEAKPASGYLFDNWSGDVTDNDRKLTLLMDSDISILANFRPVRIGDKVEKFVRAEDGGLVRLGRTKLSVPPNAMTSSTNITIEMIEVSVSGENVLGAYEIGPSGTAFSTTALLTLSYTEENIGENENIKEEDLSVYRNSGGSWIELGGDVNASTNTITVEIDHLSQYAVFEERPETTEYGNVWMFFIVFAGAVLVILVVLLIGAKAKFH